jgi:hypothetical protein
VRTQCVTGKGVSGWGGQGVGFGERTIPAPNIVGFRVVRMRSTFRSVVRFTWGCPGRKVHHWACKSLIWRSVVCRRVPNPRPGVVSRPLVGLRLVVVLLGFGLLGFGLLGLGSVVVTRRWITTQRRAWIVSLW